MMKMKRMITLAITCVTFLGVLTGCSQEKQVRKSSEYGEAEKSVSDEGWDVAKTGEVTLQNGNMRLVMDASTGHFVLQDMQHDAVYYSAISEALPEAQMDLNNKAQSELLITYYDENSQKQEMNSNQHSVAFKNFKVLTDGNAIRVYYTMQLKENPPFVPIVMDEELFKNITEKLDFTVMFKLKLMYKIYKPDDVTTEAKDIRAKYPYGKKHTLYVLKDNFSDSDRTALSGYMEQVGYTQEQYDKDIEKMGITLEKETQMQFTVPVEYTLTKEGMNVRVLSDLISGGDEAYTLQSVAVLPYLNCGVVKDEDGFMLLPDGSGSIMKLDKSDNAGYSQKVYGNDVICENQISSINTQNVVMPMYGYSSEKGSWFTYIAGSAQMAKINAYRSGSTEYCAHIYPEFDLFSTDSFTMRKSNVPLAVFSKDMPIEQPFVQYRFIEKKADIMSMVLQYRNLLQESKKMTRVDKQDAMNLYLEFTGYIEQKASFMGVSYQEKVVLSTLKDIISSVEKLYDDGIENVYVRLTGYSKNGGKYHGMSDSFSLEPKVGTFKELRQLAKLLEEHGGGLFLEEDMVSVYKDTKFDSFSSTSDTIRRLDKTLADFSDSDIVTGKTKERIHVRYLISPKLYESMATNYKKKLTKDVGDAPVYVSTGALGGTLLSDFNTKDEYDRIETSKAVQKSMEILKGDGLLMNDVGNEYVLKITDHLLNMALTDSNFAVENFNVPFYQFVLHGNKNFAGEAWNTAKNQEKTIFNSILAGANPYYSCVTNKKALETLESDQNLYPTSFDVLYESIKVFYAENEELYSLRAGKQVTDFEILADGLYRVVYEGDVTVLFNETENPVQWNEIQIEAKNYWIVRK